MCCTQSVEARWRIHAHLLGILGCESENEVSTGAGTASGVAVCGRCTRVLRVVVLVAQARVRSAEGGQVRCDRKVESCSEGKQFEMRKRAAIKSPPNG